MTPEGLEFKTIRLDDLPIYNQDFDDNNEMPQVRIQLLEMSWKKLDGFIFITPQYNRSSGCA
ncbi:NAD(P)H-dependent oxidoreductase [Flavobacterium psychroterrae]|uniref:NAD(P)H-dependent oxidoreductase n=1 Tax=Flavobacterium psychroterrae TaxID=2133767 RepID=A0ABS5P517_9FLAO|nr:NAD(P)H-dependent oxidoreductase [Flavobacterium psychroterrae]MBS7229393.1 NAD(P)H-dependent oxidoreductase [Flavobacterium psychroterrae]